MANNRFERLAKLVFLTVSFSLLGSVSFLQARTICSDKPGVDRREQLYTYLKTASHSSYLKVANDAGYDYLSLKDVISTTLNWSQLTSMIFDLRQIKYIPNSLPGSHILFIGQDFPDIDQKQRDQIVLAAIQADIKISIVWQDESTHSTLSRIARATKGHYIDLKQLKTSNRCQILPAV